MDELAINILAKWVERHCVDGHTTVWGSNDVLEFYKPVTVAMMEELINVFEEELEVLEDKVHELERGNDYE